MAMAANAESAVARATISWLNTLFREILQFMLYLILLHKSNKMSGCHNNRVSKDFEVFIEVEFRESFKRLSIFSQAQLCTTHFLCNMLGRLAPGSR